MEGGRGEGGRRVGGTSKSEGKLFQNRQDGEFYRENLKLEQLLGRDNFYK